jgi:hypothetical protein
VNLLVDMNLSPCWIGFFIEAGFEAIHAGLWGSSGLDSTSEAKRSPVRTWDVLPTAIGDVVLTLLHRFNVELERGAIVTVDMAKPRVRILPLR